MSADNWRECPKCLAEKTATHDTKEGLDLLYGKIPAGEYLERVNALENPATVALEGETFREDYEIGVGKDGVFSVSYAGSCSVCNFFVRYKK